MGLAYREGNTSGCATEKLNTSSDAGRIHVLSYLSAI